MFFKRHSKKIIPDFSMLKADIHSHLIPGIDDGSPDIETSLQLIKGMVELGYKKLITTPHIMWDMYKNTNEVIQGKAEELKKAVKDAGIDVEIHAAAEYFIDDHLMSAIDNKELLLTISEKMILIEFSMALRSYGIKDTLFKLQMEGYQPVIAHPERYVYLENGKDFYDELKDAGCLFQLNLLSLVNYYGRSANELAQYLIKKEYYDLVGTDLHNFRHLEALHDPNLSASLKKILNSGKIINDRL